MDSFGINFLFQVLAEVFKWNKYKIIDVQYDHPVTALFQLFRGMYIYDFA